MSLYVPKNDAKNDRDTVERIVSTKTVSNAKEEGIEYTGTKCDRHEWQFAIGSGHVGRSRRGRGRGPNISLEVIRSRGNLCSQRG